MPELAVLGCFFGVGSFTAINTAQVQRSARAAGGGEGPGWRVAVCIPGTDEEVWRVECTVLWEVALCIWICDGGLQSTVLFAAAKWPVPDPTELRYNATKPLQRVAIFRTVVNILCCMRTFESLLPLEKVKLFHSIERK
ncbi:hypothetical protein DFH27DRAFT_648812 [Peziza echinospora]|nr:hypothetical protein DFH27DRAFT_648812 [Peziza echinospora]